MKADTRMRNDQCSSLIATMNSSQQPVDLTSEGIRRATTNQSATSEQRCIGIWMTHRPHSTAPTQCYPFVSIGSIHRITSPRISVGLHMRHITVTAMALWSCYRVTLLCGGTEHTHSTLFIAMDWFFIGMQERHILEWCSVCLTSVSAPTRMRSSDALRSVLSAHVFDVAWLTGSVMLCWSCKGNGGIDGSNRLRYAVRSSQCGSLGEASCWPMWLLHPIFAMGSMDLSLSVSLLLSDHCYSSSHSLSMERSNSPSLHTPGLRWDVARPLRRTQRAQPLIRTLPFNAAAGSDHGTYSSLLQLHHAISDTTAYMDQYMCEDELHSLATLVSGVTVRMVCLARA